MKKLLKIVAILFLIWLLGLVSFYYLLQRPGVQTYLTQKATDMLSEQLNTQVTIGNVNIKFFRRVIIRDLYIEDQHRDTLFYTHLAEAKIGVLNLFRKKIEVKKVDLQSMKIFLHRPEANQEFNYEFITKNLSSAENGTDKKAKPYDIDLNEIAIDHFDFNFLDEFGKNQYKVLFSKLHLDAEDIDLAGKKMAFDHLQVENANVLVRKIEECSDNQQDDNSEPENNPFNPDNWAIFLNGASISSSTFQLENENRPFIKSGMDYNHLLVQDINIELNKTRIIGDTIFSKIKSLSAREKCGFIVNDLTADAQVSPVIVECKNLHVITPNSDITDYYAMRYDRFLDFNDYVHKVTMEGNFKNAKVSMKDINYFAKALSKIEQNTVDLTGNITGTVDNLKGRDLKLLVGRQSKFYGSISFKGLPDFDETFITFKADRIRTSLSDLKNIYPYIKYPANLSKLGIVDFHGNFTGFKNDFVADGNLETQIGKISSDINFKINPVTKIARYSGNVGSVDFDLGKWLDEEKYLGEITFNTYVTGTDLRLNTLEANLDGNIQKLVANNYEYSNIKMDGNLKQRFFQGSLTIHDENLDLDFQGKINLKDSIPLFEFDSEIKNANLKALNITPDEYQVSTTLRLDFLGKNIDDIIGFAAAYNTHVTKDDSLYTLDSVKINAIDMKIGKEKILTVRSDIVDGDIRGNFTFNEIPGAIKELLQHYLGTEEKENTKAASAKEKKFDFNVEIRNTKNLTELFLPALKNIEGGNIYGSFNNQTNFLGLNSTIKSGTYNNIKLNNISVEAYTKADAVMLEVSIDSLLYRDSLMTEKIALNSKVIRDKMLFNFQVQDSTNPNRLDLNGLLQTDFKSLTLYLDSSAIFFDDQKWMVSNDNKIYYDPEELQIENLTISKGINELEFKTFKDPLNNTHLSAFLRRINLKEITKPLVHLSNIEFDGDIDGKITVLNILKEPTLVASLEIDSFRINEYSVGDVYVRSNYETGDELVTVSAGVQGEANDFKLTGRYFINDKKNSLDLSCKINRFYLPQLEPFLKKNVTKINGTATGDFTVTGSFEHPVINGKLTGNEVQARVNYLNTIYSFDKEDIVFRKGEIDFQKMKLHDERDNDADLIGKIYYKDLFRDIVFDLEVDTKNFMFLNTTSASSEPFYGKVFAGGLVLITGPADKVEFFIVTTVNKDTDVSIDVVSSKDVGQYSFYHFINSKDDNNKTTYKSKTNAIILNFDLEISPQAQVNLIISSQEGDVIKAKGDGNMKMTLDEFGDFSMLGNYRIIDGDYLFTLQNIISKRFSMEKGSTIVWNGDPSDAQLDIKAVYKLRAAPYDLIEDVVSQDEPIQAAKNRVPVYLYLYITGSLLQPDIRFDIQIPDADPAIKSALESKFQLIKLDVNEFNRQVVGLLVLNRFLPIDRAASTNIASDVNNSVSEFLSNQLSIYLSDWISEFITEVELDINYRSYQNEITGVDNQTDFENRRELQLALTKSFMNDRISIDIGGNFDFGDNSTSSSENSQKATNNVAGDFEIEYSITPDGRIKVKAFRKGEYDIFQDRNKNKTGVGISYQKEFNSVQDLFENIIQNREKRKQKREEAKKETSPEVAQ